MEVHSDAGVFRADAALVTVPLGALKAGGPLAFSPPLPPTKAAAVSALGFGCLNKVVLLFPSCFWGTYDMFGHVITDDSPRGRYYLFYTYDGLAGGAVLAALVAGDAALAHESSEDDVAVAAVMSLLRGIFSPQGVEVPEPLQACGIGDPQQAAAAAGPGLTTTPSTLSHVHLLWPRHIMHVLILTSYSVRVTSRMAHRMLLLLLLLPAGFATH